MQEAHESMNAGLIEAVRRNAGLTIASGGVLVVAGLLAIVSPAVAGLSITVIVGAMLTVSGISQCFLALRTGALGKALVVFVVGVLMTVAGIYLINQPVSGLLKLTVILMAYLMASGILEIVVAFQLRPADGWGVELFNGVITLILGILLWRQFPLSGAWAIGVLFGIKLVTSGWAFIFIGRGVKKLSSDAA